MKEAYAVRRTVPPSAEIEERIDQLLAVGVGENPRESLSELAKLGARLIIQRAVEEEFDAWLGRARYERRPEYQRGLRNYDSGLRNGFRPRRVQTAEGSLRSRSLRCARLRRRSRRSCFPGHRSCCGPSR
jgi:putative transposase